MRKTASFTMDEPVLDYVAETRGKRSKSARVNELLKRAIRSERYEALEREAAEFFATEPRGARAEAKAFQKASIKSVSRD